MSPGELIRSLALGIACLACGPDFQDACEERCKILQTCQNVDFENCESSCDLDFDTLSTVGHGCASASVKAMLCLNQVLLTCIPVFDSADCGNEYQEARQECYADVVGLVDRAAITER